MRGVSPIDKHMMFWGESEEERLHIQLMNIKWIAKGLMKQSGKCSKIEKSYLDRAKRLIARSDLDRARILVEHSVTQRNLSLKYLDLACRMDVIIGTAESAVHTGRMTDGVASLLKSVSAIANTDDTISRLNKVEAMMDDLQIASTVASNMGPVANRKDDKATDYLMSMLCEQVALNVCEPSVVRKTATPSVSSHITAGLRTDE